MRQDANQQKMLEALRGTEGCGTLCALHQGTASMSSNEEQASSPREFSESAPSANSDCS